jgi:uncharacterized membrane protein
MQLVLILYCVLMPVVALQLAGRFAWAKFLGPVLLSCTFGILIANQPFMAVTPELDGILSGTSKIISSAAIPLALPLLLFQSDLSKLRVYGKTALLSFVLAVVSVFVGVLLVMATMKGDLEAPGKVAGMVMSVYIGGTPNLVAVQSALEVDKETFGLVYASTTFVSTFYLVFLLTLAKPLLRRFFPAHPDPEPMTKLEDDVKDGVVQPKRPLATTLKYGALSVLASVLCVVTSAGLTYAITGQTKGESFSLGVILTLTTLSIVGSFWKKLREIPTHEPVGMFLILVFCVSAGTMMDISKLVATGGAVLTLTTWSVVVFLLVHYVLHRLFKIDLDTTITMSVATMFGPPFIPAVVQAIDNRSVLLPCMTMGFLGYAVGTYLGIAVGYYL